MNVQVRHGFSTIGAIVQHDSEAIGQAFFIRDLTGHDKQMPEEGGVFGRCFADARDWFSGYDQQMDGSLRVNVTQYDAMIVLVNEISRNFPIDYFTEKSFFGHDP